jgi:putative hemolysin
LIELIVAILLIALNGVFALSELAIVSARRTKLKTMVEDGKRGASTALALSENPGRFLSTVQIGITLVGILAGAFSGAALGNIAGDWLLVQGVPERFAHATGYGLVIGAITYLSVVIGELVPKQLALRNAEGIACVMAPIMLVVSKVGAPIVWFLDFSTRVIFRAMGFNTAPDNAITDEEIKTLVAEAHTTGVIEADERAMIAGVLRLGGRAVRAVMTPRGDIEWLDVTLSEKEIWAKLENTEHSRLPAGDGTPDSIIGVIQVRELLSPLIKKKPLKIRDFVRQAPSIPDIAEALEALQQLRNSDVPMALVHDEYGHFEGIVTPADILDAIAGSFQSDEDVDEPESVQRDDGSWLIAGWMPVDEMGELIGYKLPEKRSYETAAGLVIDLMRKLPQTGEVIESDGFRFEVVDLDGRRVDKLMVKRIDTDALDIAI